MVIVIVRVEIFSLHTWCKDKVPVVLTRLGVQDPLHPKPGAEHVLAEHLTPQVAVVPPIINNLISGFHEIYIHSSS